MSMLTVLPEQQEHEQCIGALHIIAGALILNNVNVIII